MGIVRNLMIAGIVASMALSCCAGCSKKEESAASPKPEQPAAKGQRPPGPAAGDSMLTAPVDYLHTVVSSRRHAQETMALALPQTDIKAFNAMKGRYPESLAELEKWRGAPLPALPDGLTYSYDPKTGKLEAIEEPPK